MDQSAVTHKVKDTESRACPSSDYKEGSRDFQLASGHRDSFFSENVREVESDGDIYGLLFFRGLFLEEKKKMTIT